MMACSAVFCAGDTKDNAINKSNEQALTSGFDRSRPNQFVENMKMVGRYAALYVPNRLLDASDIISLETGFGGEVAVQFQVTRYFQFGGSHGSNYFIAKGFDRQCGGGYRDGDRFGLVCFAVENVVIDDTFGYVRKSVVDTRGFKVADFRADAYRDNDIDFWAVGGRFGWLCDFGVNVHPVEIVDFIVSCFCYDLRNDDLK
jgi:hypothetical protein